LLELLFGVWDYYLNSAYEVSLKHNVDPLIFAWLYFGTYPTLWGGLFFVGKQKLNNKSAKIPAVVALMSLLIPYIYILWVGQNLPIWVYVLIGAIAVYGVNSICKKVKKPVSGISSIAEPVQSLHPVQQFTVQPELIVKAR